MNKNPYEVLTLLPANFIYSNWKNKFVTGDTYSLVMDSSLSSSKVLSTFRDKYLNCSKTCCLYTYINSMFESMLDLENKGLEFDPESLSNYYSKFNTYLKPISSRLSLYGNEVVSHILICILLRNLCVASNTDTLKSLDSLRIKLKEQNVYKSKSDIITINCNSSDYASSWSSTLTELIGYSFLKTDNFPDILGIKYNSIDSGIIYLKSDISLSKGYPFSPIKDLEHIIFTAKELDDLALFISKLKSSFNTADSQECNKETEKGHDVEEIITEATKEEAGRTDANSIKANIVLDGLNIVDISKRLIHIINSTKFKDSKLDISFIKLTGQEDISEEDWNVLDRLLSSFSNIKFNHKLATTPLEKLNSPATFFFYELDTTTDFDRILNLYKNYGSHIYFVTDSTKNFDDLKLIDKDSIKATLSPQVESEKLDSVPLEAVLLPLICCSGEKSRNITGCFELLLWYLSSFKVNTGVVSSIIDDVSLVLSNNLIKDNNFFLKRILLKNLKLLRFSKSKIHLLDAYVSAFFQERKETTSEF